jgi:membrane protease subunit (stomatin/prohibitin family)
MGIFDFVKGGVRELAIARPDAAKDFWVYKHPDQTVPMKAQLTVDSDETALFFRDGRYVGLFGPGRHTLDSQNIPFLGQLVDKFTGGNVFIAEVFFVNTREHPDIKFGTSVGDVTDPETKMQIRLMVHGSFSARVHDPVRFVTGLVGQRMADNQAFLGWFKSQVQKTIKENIAELIVKKKWPVADVTSGAYTSDIEAETVKETRPHVDSYGVEIIRFGDFTISMDQKDRERIARYRDRFAYVDRISQNPQGYHQFAAAEMMLGAAEGMAKGGAGAGNAMAGAGIGLGFGMAGQMYGNAPPPFAQQYAQPHAQPAHAQQVPQGAPQAAPGARVTCPGCSAQVAPGKFCVECGKSLPEVQARPKFCSSCGAALAGKFCAQCGTPAA